MPIEEYCVDITIPDTYETRVIKMRTEPSIISYQALMHGRMIKKLIPRAKISYSARRCTKREDDWRKIEESELEAKSNTNK
jgi:hypothetical protein